MKGIGLLIRKGIGVINYERLELSIFKGIG